MDWGFYGRDQELLQLREVLSRNRWFFARLTGRRRIGKTTLIQRALQVAPPRSVFYVQVPDSAPAGILSAVHDAMDTFGLAPHQFRRPDSLLALARTVEDMVSAGYLVALDEFQYFSRKHLIEFTSHLQAVVDRLSARADSVSGGLIVLGSIHTELVALLEDRSAPLYNRTTDHLELAHLDVASVQAILDAHADRSPERLLFLWNLFEGVPKFYRDAYEQGVLAGDRKALLAGMFFRSSSPLRNEADHWFLSELRGRYDVVLKYVARHPGCTNADILAHVREVSPSTVEQVGGYLKVLRERYRMVERRLPVLARPDARRGRYYLCDNFLRSWLAALHSPASAVNFRPEPVLVEQADVRLAQAEGHGLERLARQLYEERSRRGVGDFALTRHIEGYWDRNDTEIDLVAVNEDDRVVRFGTVKRNPERLLGSLYMLQGHVGRFLAAHRPYRDWRHERVAIAPNIGQSLRNALHDRGVIAEDLNDLTRGL
ncbi:MAG: AAA family ATPase [Acidobacteriota bacterium]